MECNRSQFHSLHVLFQGQYTELAQAIDEIAERIRTLGDAAPGTFKEYLKLTLIKEEEGVPPSSEMVSSLAKDQEKVVTGIQKLMPIVQEQKDEATYDLLVQRVQTHQKNHWMLKSSI